ncbi:MAG: J domain-containing protein [Spirochaetia bacterium]
MPDIFDSIESFFRSLFRGDENYSTDAEGKRRYYDPDMQDAWDELDEYLREGKNTPKPERPRTARNSASENARRQRIRHMKEALRQDYAILKVRFDTPFEEVKKAHKNLLRQYHPDRFANDPARFKTATEIAQKINQAFQNIKAFEQQKKKM